MTGQQEIEYSNLMNRLKAEDEQFNALNETIESIANGEGWYSKWPVLVNNKKALYLRAHKEGLIDKDELWFLVKRVRT